MIDLIATFEKFDNEHRKFNCIENKLHARRDLCAFLLLDRLLYNQAGPVVSAADHDVIFLDADCEKLAEVATEQDILMLTRCGVHYDVETDGLAMFV